MFRLLGILSTGLWLAAMAALIHRDVWPAWVAQDAPNVTATPLSPDQPPSEYRILDRRGREIGAAWSTRARIGDRYETRSVVVFEDIPPLQPVLIEMGLVFLSGGDVDSIALDVHGVRVNDERVKIALRGENYGRYISCDLQVGPLRQSFRLDASQSRLISDGVRTFDTLPNLSVGQSWCMQTIDPFSAMLHRETSVSTIVAKVVRRETITLAGAEPVDCFVVTAGPATAWVRPDGRVVAEETRVPLPGVGAIRIEERAFSANRLEAAQREFGIGPPPGPGRRPRAPGEGGWRRDESGDGPDGEPTTRSRRGWHRRWQP